MTCEVLDKNQHRISRCRNITISEVILKNFRYTYFVELAWSTYRKFSYYTEYISFVFILLYIWEISHSLTPLLIFAIIYSLASPLGSYISVYITNSISPRIALLLGFLLQTIQVVIFITQINSTSTEVLIIIGLLGGLSSGIKQIPEYTYERYYQSKTSQRL